jgi:transporter family-2 protein
MDRGLITGVEMMNALLLPAIALACGCLQPLQAVVNGRAALAGVGALWTGVISAGTSMLTLALLSSLLLRKSPPAGELLASQGPTIVVGGMMGAFLVSGMMFVAPRLGPTQTFLLYFGAVTLTSIGIDQFGLLGQPVRPIRLADFAGAVLVIAGIAITRLAASEG